MSSLIVPGSPEFYDRSYDIFPEPNGVYGKAVNSAFTILAASTGGYIVEGQEHIPEEGPFAVGAKHISHLDIPAVAKPVHDKIGIPPHFLSKPGHFDSWRDALIVGLGGGFIFDRDDAAIESQPRVHERLHRISVNQDGTPNKQGIVVVFPEGTRNRMDGRVGATLGYIAAMYGISVVPVGVAGTSKKDFGIISVVYAELIKPPDPDPNLTDGQRASIFRKKFTPIMHGLTEKAEDNRQKHKVRRT